MTLLNKTNSQKWKWPKMYYPYYWQTCILVFRVFQYITHLYFLYLSSKWINTWRTTKINKIHLQCTSGNVIVSVPGSKAASQVIWTNNKELVCVEWITWSNELLPPTRTGVHLVVNNYVIGSTKSIIIQINWFFLERFKL